MILRRLLLVPPTLLAVVTIAFTPRGSDKKQVRPPLPPIPADPEV